MKWYLFFLFVLCDVFFACSEEDSHRVFPNKVSSYKVAVIAPAAQPQWKRTADWALDNIRKSQMTLPEQVDLQLVWIDESDSHITNRMKSVLNDSTIVAVVGPISSSKANVMASFDASKRKPLIFPCATATDLHRMYANCDYVWNLSANDVEQIEILMIHAKTYGYRSVHMLVHDDDYGETFLSWMPFVAEQYGIDLGLFKSFESAEEEIDRFEEIINTPRASWDLLIFVPSSTEDIVTLDRHISKMPDSEKISLPQIMSTDAFTTYGANLEPEYNDYEGVDIAASVESGFITAYKTHFGVAPVSGEAQFYDAFVLLSLALSRVEVTGGALNESLKRVVNGEEIEMASWLPADMTDIYRNVRQGRCPDIKGVSGDLSFREGTTSIQHSTYRHWRIDNHEIQTIEYLSTQSSSHSLGAIDIFSWDNSVDYDFYWNPEWTINYPSLDKCWALLVAGSQGWNNYRHQADVYAMYQLLRRHGYAADHIIMIAEDDIAYNLKNVHPGEVRIVSGGENVYENLKIDYNLSSLKPSDLRSIMCGLPSNSIDAVIPSDYNDNVFVYWCGHGSQGELEFGDYAISGEMMASICQEMADKRRFRKLFFAIEACYGGSIGECLEGIPGLLCMSATNEHETSKADIQDTEMGVWLSNGFTRGFQNAIDRNPNIMLSDLFFELTVSTWGSHVSLYNASNYGSMYENYMSEFLPK